MQAFDVRKIQSSPDAPVRHALGRHRSWNHSGSLVGKSWGGLAIIHALNYHLLSNGVRAPLAAGWSPAGALPTLKGLWDSELAGLSFISNQVRHALSQYRSIYRSGSDQISFF